MDWKTVRVFLHGCLFYICDFLEVTPSEFFNVDIEEPQKLKELYEEIKSFDSERLELLTRLIKYMR